MFACEMCWDTPCSCGHIARQQEEDRAAAEYMRQHPELAPTAADYARTIQIDPATLEDADAQRMFDGIMNAVRASADLELAFKLGRRGRALS